MKKTYIILTLFLAALFVSSCSTNFDDYDSERPVGIRWMTAESAPLVVTPATGPTVTTEVEYWISGVSSSDRTFNVVIEPETDLAPENYSFPTSFVVPANQDRGTLTFTGTDVSLTDEFQQLVVSIEGTDEVFSVVGSHTIQILSILD